MAAVFGMRIVSPAQPGTPATVVDSGAAPLPGSMSELDISHLFEHTIEHFRLSRTRDTDRGTISTSTTSLGNVAGRIVQTSYEDEFVAQREEARVTHAIYLAPDADVRRNDEFTFEGRTFRVVIPNLTPSKAIYQKVLTEEVQRAAESSL